MAGENAGANGTDGKGTSTEGTAGGATGSTTTTTPPGAGANTETLLGAPKKDEGTKTEGGEKKTEAPKVESTKVDIKLPEGFDAKNPLLGKFTEVAQKSGLKSEQAQAIFDTYASHLAEVAKQDTAADQQLVQSWREATEKDPALGLNGAKRDENLALYRNTVTRLGGPELQQILHETGLANHPAVVKAFLSAGRAIGEDTVRGSQNGAPPKSNDANAVYRDLFPNSPTLFTERQ